MAKVAEKKAQVRTHGFGVPDVVDPHHFVVRIPRGTEDVLVIENFGVNAVSRDDDTVIRCRLSRKLWNGIKEEARRALNERLVRKNLKTSKWQTGDNPIERLLGKEVCLLAWAAEGALPSQLPAACAAWAALKPEERWWLFKMCDNAGGTAEDTNRGWRWAVRAALTDVVPTEVIKKRKKRPADPEASFLPLFDER